MNPVRAAAVAACLAASAALSGCVSLLPKAEPVTLYSFRPDTPARAAAPSAERVPVLAGRVEFPRAATGDRLFTVDGATSAYVAGARWAAPAVNLFTEAMDEAFARRATRVRLVERGQPTAPRYLVNVTVRDFTAIYDRGPRAAPEIVVSFDAQVSDMTGRQIAGERFIQARVRASENRVSAMADAWKQATDQALGELVTFVDDTAR